MEEEVISMLETYGFDKDYAKKCIDANIHNHVTSTYYIILNWFIKIGKIKEEEKKEVNLLVGVNDVSLRSWEFL